MTERPLLLLDSASLYYRAFYSQPTSLTTPDGTPNNAVRGFLDAIARFARDTDARQVVAAWDTDWRPQWRVDLIDTYKTHRVAEGSNEPSAEAEPDELSVQIPLIEEALAAVGIPIVGWPDHEADDVLATLAAREPGPGVVVTGDRDLFALVDDARGISVLYTGRGAARPIDGRAVLAEYGVRAEQYVDMAVLRGDTSDGLPGVKGIGPKTAAALLVEFGSLEALRAAALDPQSSLRPKVRESLIAAASYLDVAPAVVQPVTGLPLPDLARRGLRPSAVDESRVAEVSTRLGIRASLGRLAAVMSAQVTDE